MSSGLPSKRYIYWVAWRNLVSRQRGAALSFMTIISICGVGIGVAALIVVLSVMGGFEQDLRDKMLRGQPHIELLSARNALAGFGLKEYSLQAVKAEIPELTDMQAYTQADVVLKQKKHITSAVLFGVDPERDGHLWGFSGAMTEGEMGAIGRTHPASGNWDVEVRRPGILLGEQLAEQLGADQGDEITVLSPQANTGTALSGGTVSRHYVVAGKFRTGMFNYDAKWAVVSLDEGRRFMPDWDESLDEEEYVTGLAINVSNPDKIDVIERRLFPKNPAGEQVGQGALKGLSPLTWQKANKSLLFALKLEKFAMGSILMLIVVVAGFSISGTMMMTVFHRRGQVGLLRSLGMSRRDISRLFLAHGFSIGSIGILSGLLVGLGLCALIKSFQFIQLPAGVYHLKSLPCKWLWLDYGAICLMAWAFSVIASLYPAMTAARQDPGTGLRYL